MHCDFRDHGPAAGIEAMFYEDGELLTSRRFDPRPDPTRTPRALPIPWAEEERRALDASGIAP